MTTVPSTILVHLIIIFEFVLIICSRYSYNFLSQNQIAGDAFGNFLLVRDIRRTNHRLPLRPRQSVMSGNYAYPYFVLWLLSYLPERYLPKVDKIFSPLMDFIMGAVLLSLVPLEILSEQAAAVALGVLLFTPQFMRPDLSHGKGFTQRKPGLLLTSVSVLLFLIWFNGGPLITLGISALLGSLVCLTSKFSLQAMAFIYLGFAIVLTPVSFLVPLTAVVLAIAISKGKYYRILSGHLRHLYDYARVRQYQRFEHTLPNPISYFQSLRRLSSQKDFLEFVYSTKFTKALLDNPFLIGVGASYVFILNEQTLFNFAGFYTWISVGIVCFVAISMPHLLFLGLSERYLEYILLPSAALIGVSATVIPGYWLILIPIFGIGVVVQTVYLWGYANVFHDPERKAAIVEVTEYLKEKEGDVVAVQPAYTAREIAWRTGKKILEDIGGHSTSTEEAREEKNKLFSEDKADYITGDVEWIDKRYNPDWVVFDTEKIEDLRLKERSAPGLQPPELQPEYENDKFAIYKFAEVK